MISRILSLVALLCFLVWGCSDVFEDDLSDKEIILVSPADGVELRTLTPTLQWKEIKDLKEYRVKIGSPTIENPSDFLIDTVVTNKTKLTVTLDTTLASRVDTIKFEWGVAAKNSSSESNMSKRVMQFTKAFSSIPPEAPILSSPTNEEIFTITDVKFPVPFSWQRKPLINSIHHDQLLIFSATSNELLDKPINVFLSKDSFDQDNIPVKVCDTTILLSAGKYYCVVQSINKNGRTSNFSNTRSFEVKPKTTSTNLPQ